MPGDISLSSPSALPRWLARSSTLARIVALAVASLLLWLVVSRPSTASHRSAKRLVETTLPRISTSRLRQLKGSPRSGLGGRMQRACGEMEETITYWLDAFERMETGSGWCPSLDGGDHEKERLLNAASRQCGSWCVWDPNADDVAGWYVQPGDTGACFIAFTSPHHCDEWLGMRDKLLESKG